MLFCAFCLLLRAGAAWRLGFALTACWPDEAGRLLALGAGACICRAAGVAFCLL